MVQLNEIIKYLDDLLGVAGFKDYCPNGLQVEGKQTVHNLVTGVTASAALLDKAINCGADAVLVHHGYFWKGDDPCVVGIKQRRLKKLLGADISLLAYHLPLDAHPVYGNNAQLAKVLDLDVLGTFGFGPGPDIGMFGTTGNPVDGEQFANHIEHKLGRKPLHIAGSDKPMQTLGWCTGAAQSYIDLAVERGLDAFLTGEVSEQTVHIARETGIHFYAAGHHATERYGVKALGTHLAEVFDLAHEFMDIDNPV
jgi:dinuclear metal center YbgI/SA1388 family protein